MRHGKTFNHLGRTASHRRALLSNMASSLILHKRISTTVAKAKALRKYVEPIITKSKSDSTHNRRIVFSYLQDKESVKILFDEISEKVNDRPGGYTRIIKMGNRLGDNAEMCMMELVDYNELLLEDKAPAKAKTRRSRRGKKKSTDAEVEATPVAETSVVEEAEVIEEPAAEVAEEVKAEEVVEEVKAEEVESATEETKEDSGDKSEPETDSEEDSKKE
jgi:large subunit ribosomal protein L17